MIDLTAKLGEMTQRRMILPHTPLMNDIEYNKGSKIYPQNQVILDCILPIISLKHKC